MVASVQNPADVVNISLSQIGYKLRIGSLFDGSPAARKALDIYGQTRDALLRAMPWGFAQQIIAGVLGGTPQFPWTVSYAYPANCIMVRDLIAPAYANDLNNPLPVLWTIANDPATGRSIWSKTAGATIVFTAQVTDPKQWDTLFVDLLAIQIGKKLSLPLANGDSLKAEMENEKIIVPIVESTAG